MAEAVTLLGEGGVEWTFDLPLSEAFADQVRARKLQPVNEKSRKALAHLLEVDSDEPTASQPAPPADPVPDPVVPDPVTDPDPAGEEGDGDGEKLPLDLDALGKMKLVELRAVAKDIGVDDATLASFEKNGTAKKTVIAAIVAADAAE